MNNHTGQSVSPWMATPATPNFTTLTTSTHSDVCIIGAGISGLTTAYLLTRAGKSVIVLDNGFIFSGETERTTAHLTNALDSRYFELERLHGKDGARIAAQSHSAAIDLIEQIISEEKIDCDFERLDGYLFASQGESSQILEKELTAVLHAGLDDVQLIAHAPITSFHTGQALRFPRQAQIHPTKYLCALANAIIRRGSKIYTQTHVTKVTGGKLTQTETDNGSIVSANAAIVTTNTPINDSFAMHTKQAAYRTYVIGALVPTNSITRALYWDTSDPYHYVRLQSLPPNQLSLATRNELLIIGGEDHKTGQADDAGMRYQRLEEWARTRFPMITDVQF